MTFPSRDFSELPDVSATQEADDVGNHAIDPQLDPVRGLVLPGLGHDPADLDALPPTGDDRPDAVPGPDPDPGLVPTQLHVQPTHAVQVDPNPVELGTGDGPVDGPDPTGFAATQFYVLPTHAYDEPGPEVRDHRDEEPVLPPGDSNDEDAIVRDHRDGPLDDFHFEWNL